MDKRVQFDFEIEFTNGGGIQGQDFRLDIAGDSIEDEILANYIVEDLRLLMVGEVRILNKIIVSEPHKRKPIDANAPKTLIDLSHTVKDGLITYKGLPAPIICDYLSREESKTHYAEGTTFQIGKIEMVANTGTYLDSPFHRYEEGHDLSQLRLEQMADLEAIIIRAPFQDGLAIHPDRFKNKEIRGRAVLVHTGWDIHWNTEDYFENHPYLTEETAVYLQKRSVKLVGIDSVNIDDTSRKSRPVHSTLLKNNILIVEHLCNLQNLPDENIIFSAIPPMFVGVGTFPVRAFAKVG